MGLWAYMKTWMLLYVLLGYVFIVSGLIINFLMLCSCIIWPFNHTLYRKINHYLAYSLWCQITFLGQWWSGSECAIYMKPEDLKLVGGEHALVLMNHKYDIDWLMGWLIIERFGMLGGSKIYGKKILQYVPLIGWAWYFTESIFLKRDWDQDKITLVKDIKKLTEFPENYWITILLFCEGTRFTKEKHKISMEVARKKGYPELKHHLLPRSKGFILSMHGLKGKVPAIYDCVIGFRKDGAEPTLMNVIKGKSCQAEMHVRRILTDSVPSDTDEACAEWLQNHYREKDEIYDSFVKNGHFDGVQHKVPKRVWDLLVWLCWAVVLCVPLFVYAGKILLFGSLTMKLTLGIIMFSTSRLVQWMISITEIKKGSTYGYLDGAKDKKSE